MTSGSALQGMVVTELGGRDGVAVCGSLLAQLGATVIVVEPLGNSRPRDAHRAQFTAGKRSLAVELQSAADRELLQRLAARSNVVVVSSDIDPPALQFTPADPANVVCDITAFGSAGPLAGQPATEWQVQALAGIMDTTGFADGPPLPVGVPILGYSAGTYAATAVLAALRARRLQGLGQRVEVAMYDSAFVGLSNFMLGILDGRKSNRTRTGNTHPSIVPWSQYATSDGMALIAAGNQGQWQRLCGLMQRPDLAEQFATQGLRLAHAREVDAAIEAWTRTLDTETCVQRLVEAGVAAGPITPIEGHPRDANIEFRGMVRELLDPVSGRRLAVPGSPITLRGSPPAQPERIPAPDADRAEIERLAAQPDSRLPVASAPPARSLAGLRIIEVGQYTSVPQAARHLAHLGADVIKIEKPGGDESRSYEPRHGERSENYCFNNAEKRSLMLDLRQPGDQETLKALLRTADVLMENNKPGTLAKYGLDPQALARLNPRLVYCALSGFGADSKYGDRPGFDTVIQAMSGFMTAVNPGGTPIKTGISAADMMGTEATMVAILGALEYRDRTGRGQFIDLSMQDIGCWVTATVWNQDLQAIARPAVLRCADGWVMAGMPAQQLQSRLEAAGLSEDALAALSRAEADSRLRALGLPSAPVLGVTELVTQPHSQARRLIFKLPAEGLDLPMLACPMVLQRTPAQVTRQAPLLNADGPAILAELGQG